MVGNGAEDFARYQHCVTLFVGAEGIEPKKQGLHGSHWLQTRINVDAPEVPNDIKAKTASTLFDIPWVTYSAGKRNISIVPLLDRPRLMSQRPVHCRAINTSGIVGSKRDQVQYAWNSQLRRRPLLRPGIPTKTIVNGKQR